MILTAANFQVTASVLRNLSWHPSSGLMVSLINSNAARKLMITAINSKKESTLKAALSALWNLSAHSHANKVGQHSPVQNQSQSGNEFIAFRLQSVKPLMQLSSL